MLPCLHQWLEVQYIGQPKYRDKVAKIPMLFYPVGSAEIIKQQNSDPALTALGREATGLHISCCQSQICLHVD